MFRLTRLRGFALAGILFLGGLPLSAAEGRKDYKVTIFWENDAFAGQDRHYTQGAGISYLSPDLDGPDWLVKFSNWLPRAGIEPAAHQFGLGMTQEIYTPEDLRSSDVVVNDRPYAGWLYARLALHRRGPGWFEQPAKDSWGIDLGVVGPASLAEQTQKTWHDQEPRGWDNQLKNEPAFAFFYEKSSLWRKGTEEGWSAGLIPYWGANAGTIAVQGRLGTRFQIGFNVPDTYAVPAPRRHFGVYFFGGMEGRLVLHNLFLDGNTFTDSHSVEKEPLVGEIHVGASLVLKRLELSARQTMRTHEFEGQKENDTFTAAFVSFTF